MLGKAKAAWKYVRDEGEIDHTGAYFQCAVEEAAIVITEFISIGSLSKA